MYEDIDKLKKNLKDWTITDPDNLQFVHENKITFIEFNRQKYPEHFKKLIEFQANDKKEFEEKFLICWKKKSYWVTKTVFTETYSLKEQKEMISAYYDGLDDLVEQYGDDADFILAECIFEQTNGLY